MFTTTGIGPENDCTGNIIRADLRDGEGVLQAAGEFAWDPVFGGVGDPSVLAGFALLERSGRTFAARRVLIEWGRLRNRASKRLYSMDF